MLDSFVLGVESCRAPCTRSMWRSKAAHIMVIQKLIQGKGLREQSASSKEHLHPPPLSHRTHHFLVVLPAGDQAFNAYDLGDILERNSDMPSLLSFEVFVWVSSAEKHSYNSLHMLVELTI